MKFAKTRDVKSPTRANPIDAGIDFFIPNDFPSKEIRAHEKCLIPSGIKVNVPEGYALIAFNKSGVATGRELQVGACVVDSGYQGEVHFHLFNYGKNIVHIHPGDKIVQFVLLPLGDPAVKEVQESELYSEVSDRGEGGFGSTGEK